MKTLNQLRQGDVLLVAVDTQPPKNAVGKSEVILAVGEITGHAHRLTASAVLEWEEKGQRYVRVVGDAPGALSHEEHDPTPVQVVTPGQTYQVIPQREWNLSDQWQPVRD